MKKAASFSIVEFYLVQKNEKLTIRNLHPAYIERKQMEKLRDSSIEEYKGKKAGIPSRCIYMVRKTYASVLADDKDVPETLISDSMGHRDFKVTRKHYIKGRTVKSAEAAVIEHALNAKIPSHKSVTPSNTNSEKRKAPKTA